METGCADVGANQEPGGRSGAPVVTLAMTLACFHDDPGMYNTTQLCVSAARCIKRNLAIWSGTNTSTHHLTRALPHFSEALQTSFSVTAESAPQTPQAPNVKWQNRHPKRLRPYTPDLAYATLTLEPGTPPPTLPAPSSLTVSFEDPDGTSAQTLLCH